MEQGEIWAGYWVGVQGLATREAAESSIFQSDPGKITRLEMRACPAATAG